MLPPPNMRAKDRQDAPEQRKQAEVGALAARATIRWCKRVRISAEMARNEQCWCRARRRRLRAADGQREGARSSFSFSCKLDGGTLTGKGESVTEGERISTWLETKGKNGAGKSQSMRARVPHEVPGQRLRRRQAAVRADGGGVGRQQRRHRQPGARQIERGKALIAID